MQILVGVVTRTRNAFAQPARDPDEGFIILPLNQLAFKHRLLAMQIILNYGSSG
ncbi:unnamed protein product [marine sediment metagenome]|uniref:Uncharacterized protein n=1 Tax=marine sediment metagenome TaxID=412755 RepID=X1MQI4_9ZZZZ